MLLRSFQELAAGANIRCWLMSPCSTLQSVTGLSSVRQIVREELDREPDSESVPTSENPGHMYVCICVCVCMDVWRSVAWAHSRMYACACMPIYARTCARTFARTHSRVHLGIYVCIF